MENLTAKPQKLHLDAIDEQRERVFHWGMQTREIEKTMPEMFL
jgi:hypothetical protein